MLEMKQKTTKEPCRTEDISGDYHGNCDKREIWYVKDIF